MNTQRVVILGVAVFAAGMAALLARGLLGGGTEKARAIPFLPRPVTSEVLVAATDLQAGTALKPGSVRWQEWPKSSVDSSFIRKDAGTTVDTVTKGTVVRQPVAAGQPLTAAMMVHADAAGIMAAMVQPGMRAVSIGISTEMGAGGFILPNDRVDVLLTKQVSDTPRLFASATLLKAVRVLAMDQTYEDKDQKVVLARTATLELTPIQAEQVEVAQAVGTLSLTLRALGDDGAKDARKDNNSDASGDQGGSVTIIRYGVGHAGRGPQGE